MGLRKKILITTWVISLAVLGGFFAFGVNAFVDGYTDCFVFFIIAFASFAGIWLIYWILFWSVRGFQKIGKKRVLQIIKWSFIIFFASVLFHLADYVVHKAIKGLEEKPNHGSRFKARE